MPPFDENARGDTWNVSPDKWKVLDRTLLSREARHISRYLPMPSFHVWRCCMAFAASVQQIPSRDVLLTVGRARLLEDTCHSHYAHRTFARWTLQLIPHRATPSQAQESECRLIQRYGKRVWTGFSLPKMLHSG